MNGYGPYFLVPLGSGSEPELMVAVAAYATGVKITEQGWIDFPPDHGNEFVASGIPVDGSGYRFLPAESAVAEAATRTGARVAKVPELVLLGRPHSPLAAAWKVSLDRPVELKTGNGALSATRELYLSSRKDLGFLRSRGSSRRTYRAPALRIDHSLDEPIAELVELPIRTGYATDFATVATFQPPED